MGRRKLPEIFQHNLVSFEKRDRISQNFVSTSANLLLSAMNKGNASFLKNYSWSSYNYWLEDLHTDAQSCRTVMKDNSSKQISRQNTSKSQMNNSRLKEYTTVTGKSGNRICSIYNILFQKLQKMKFYEYLIITADDIDEWCSDRISDDETTQTAYKKRQRF